MASDEQISKDLKAIQEVANFLNIRSLYNRDLLESKFNEEKQFGASAWAIQAKALYLDDVPKEDLNARILQWIQTLPFSSNQQEQIFKVLSRSIEQLEEGEIKTALQSCLTSKNLDALLSLQSTPETFSSLEDILCLGSVDDLRQWKKSSQIDKDDLEGAAEIVSARGDPLLLREVLEGQVLSKEERGGVVILAANLGNLGIVRELLTNGMISEKDRKEAVYNAAEKGYLDIVKELLNSGPIPKRSRGESAASAAKGGHLEVVLELLKDNEEYRGFIVLHAAMGGNLNIVKELLKDGAVISEEFREEAKQKSSGPNKEEIIEFLDLPKL